MAPEFVYFIYAYILVLLAVLVRWEFKRAKRRMFLFRSGFVRQAKV